MNYLLEIRGLHKSYGSQRALVDFSCYLEPSQCHVVMGGALSGKTTLFRILSQEISPSGGDVYVRGLDLRDDPYKVKRTMAFMGWQDSMDVDFSVYDNLVLQSRFLGISRRESCQRARELLRMFDIEDLEHHHLHELGLLDLRCVQLCRALVSRPQVLILDEPTKGLSPPFCDRIIDRLEQLKTEGLALLILSGRVHEAERLATRVHILEQGCQLKEGSPSELLGVLEGQEVVEFSVLAHDLDYHLAKLDNKSPYQILDGRVRIFLATSQMRKSVVDAIASDHVSIRPACLSDVYIKIVGRDIIESLP